MMVLESWSALVFFPQGSFSWQLLHVACSLGWAGSFFIHFFLCKRSWMITIQIKNDWMTITLQTRHRNKYFYPFIIIIIFTSPLVWPHVLLFFQCIDKDTQPPCWNSSSRCFFCRGKAFIHYWKSTNAILAIQWQKPLTSNTMQRGSLSKFTTGTCIHWHVNFSMKLDNLNNSLWICILIKCLSLGWTGHSFK